MCISIKKFAYILVPVVLMMACLKTETPPQKIDFITGDVSKDWFVEAAKLTFTIESGKNPREVELILDCQKDDKWTFYRDGKLEIRDNNTKCQGVADLKQTAAWIPNDTFTTMAIPDFKLGGVSNTNNVMFEINDLTTTTMTLAAKSILKDVEVITVKYVTK